MISRVQVLTNNMDLMYFVALLIACLAVFWAKWVTISAWRKAAAAPLPPGPRGVPILGYLPFLGIDDLHLTFAHLAGIYGPIYKVWLGNKMCLILSSPTVVKEVVREKDIIFANRDSPAATLIATYDGCDVGFSDYHLEWRRMRKLFVQEMLNNAGLDGCYNIRREEVQKAIRRVYKKVGTTVSIRETMLHTTISAVLGMVWGGAILENNNDQEFRELFAELTEVFVTPNVSDLFPAVAWLDLQGLAKRMRKLFAQVDQFYNRVIEQKMRQMKETSESVNIVTGRGKTTKDLLQHLLELKHHKDVTSPSSSFTMTQLKALLQDIVLGSTETTATILEWAMSELLVHHEVLQTVYRELNGVVGLNNVVEESHVPKLRYLKAVLKETHRLHPAAPFLIPRKPSETTTVSGYTVPKGSKVFINVWAIHRDPHLWDSPLEFRPERFLDEEESSSAKLDFSGNNFKYMPFGSGRRMCPGLPLADRFVLHLFASLVHSFNWHAPDGAEIDFKAKFGLVCKKAIPLVAVPTPRHTNLELYV